MRKVDVMPFILLVSVTLIAVCENELAAAEPQGSFKNPTGALKKPPKLDEYASPLHWAVYFDKNDEVRRLIERGAHVNAVVSATGETPLHFAALAGNVESAKLLIEHGADVNRSASDGLAASGYAPLHSATFAGHPELVELLLKAGADVKSRTNFGHTPLHMLNGNGDADKNVQIIQMLIAAGADVNATSGMEKWTPLNRAQSSIYNTPPKVIEALRAAGGKTAQELENSRK